VSAWFPLRHISLGDKIGACSDHPGGRAIRITSVVSLSSFAVTVLSQITAACRPVKAAALISSLTPSPALQQQQQQAPSLAAERSEDR